MKISILILSILLNCNHLIAHDKNDILVLLSFHTTLPWTKQFVEGLEAYNKTNPNNFEFHIEQIDALRLKGGANNEVWASYIKDKYKNITLDGIVIESEVASKLYDATKEILFPNIPAIALSNSNMKADLKLEINFQKLAQMSIELAMRHNEDLEFAYIIDSSFTESIEIKESLLKTLEKTTIKPIILKNFTKDSLLRDLQSLPKNSAIFYTVLFEDANKERFIPKEFLKEITAKSNMPVYIFYSSMLNTGAIGGITQDGAMVAKKMLNMLDGRLNGDINPKQPDPFLKAIDWQVMKKFNIQKSSNPKDAFFINKPVPIWESYPRETLYGLIVLILMISLIFLLIALGIRNKKISAIEKQMFIQARHAAMGEMLSAIAHQWRQPLNTLYIVLQNYRLIMKKSGVEDEKLQQLDEKSDKLITQMSQTIDDFKDFFKPRQNKITFLPKDELLRSIELIDVAFSKENIKIELLELNDQPVFGYPNELGQCFLNILQNAKDELRKVTHERLLTIQMKDNSNSVSIIFLDNARGIENKNLNKIFEPYFTTKENSGTGIGLYMTKMIIEDHMNGKIFVKNIENGGAKFTIVLPVWKENL